MTDSAGFSDQARKVAANFDMLAVGYDRLHFSRLSATRLVELAGLHPGQQALDVATGTGWAALAAATAVGPTGRVVGIDISREMLEQARQKIEAACLTNVDLREGDAAALDLPDDSFDVVLSSLGLFFLPDMLATLREWRRVIRPGGRVAFSALGEGFQQPLVDLYEQRLRRYGITPPAQLPGQRLTNPETSRALLRDAGFEQIEVRSEQPGYYLSSADQWWDEIWYGIRRMPLAQLSPEQLAQFKAEHLAEVAALATDQGIWLDAASIFAQAQKPTRAGG